MSKNIFATPPSGRRRQPIVLISIVVVALLVIGVAGRAWYMRTVQATEIGLNAPNAAHPVILTPSDVSQARRQALVINLPVTGTLRAKDTAQIVARVPGVLHDLTVREGDAVLKGQVIARVAPEEYDQRYQQAQLQAQAARAQMEIAQRQHDNNVALEKQNFISPTALSTSRANLDAARANYRAAQAGAAVTQQSVADTVLKAPITGAVSRRLVQPGEHVVTQQPVVEIVDLSQLELQAMVSPSDSLQVRVGQTARLTVEGVPDTVTATVTRINPSAQAGSRNVLVYLTLPANQPGLRQGLFAQGRLETGLTNSVLAIPLDAVRPNEPQPYVELIKDDRVHLVAVETGVRGTVGSVTGAANAAASIAGNSETWVAIHPLGGPESAASQPAASAAIQPGDWVLRGSAGDLTEGTLVKQPQVE